MNKTEILIAFVTPVVLIGIVLATYLSYKTNKK